MPKFPSFFGGTDESDEELFVEYGEFDPEFVPDPGEFLDSQHVLTGVDHTAFHRLTKESFEQRGVYDMTFGYNLARLNVDTRHPDAGFRYAEQTDDRSVLRAEFTPTTAFCPQTDTLTGGAFRAWNELRDRHEYSLVRVRVAEMHEGSTEINEALERQEETFRAEGRVPELFEGAGDGQQVPPGEDRNGERTDGPNAPF